jgi:hypothetical protein
MLSPTMVTHSLIHRQATVLSSWIIGTATVISTDATKLGHNA